MDAREKRNLALDVVGESCWGVVFSIVLPATVLTVLLKDHGASKTMIGVVTALDCLYFLPQIIGVYVFASTKNRKQHLVWWHVLAVTPSLFCMAALAAGAGRLAPGKLCWGLIMCQAAYCLGIGIVNCAWIDWMANLWRIEIRGRVLGVCFAAFSLAGMAAALVAAALISRMGHAAYVWLYSLAGAMALFSMVVFARIIDPMADMPQDSARPDLATLRARIRESLADRNFRAYLGARGLGVAGFMVLPFATVYYTSPAGGGLSNAQVVQAGAMLTLGIAISNIILGRLGDRHGHRLGLMIASLAQLVALIIILSSSGRVSCIAAYLAAGFAVGGLLVAHNNILIETCAHDLRIAHLSIAGMVLGAIALVVPLVAGVVAERWGLRPIFAVSLGLGSLGLFCLLVFVKDPRHLNGQDG